MMNHYLSYGGGVNSTALMLLLIDQGIEFESVFIDHETDYPETYEYVAYLKEKGYKITELKPSVSWKGHWSSVYDYFFHHKSIPLIVYRICTDKFKVQTFNKHIEKPCIVYIGYDYDEVKRANKQKGHARKGIEYQYPLIEKLVTRKGCEQIILDHGLKVPPKSGCYICPFQKKSEWRRLEVEHPELFQKALELETNCGKKGLYAGSKTLSSLHQDSKLDDWIGFDGDLSCTEWKCRE